MKTKKRTKPTNAEIGKVIGDITKTQGGLIEWVEYLKKRIDLVDNTLGAYLAMNKDGQKLAKHKENTIKEQKEKSDEEE